MEEGRLEGCKAVRLEAVKLEDFTLEHYRFTIFLCYLERSIDQLS
jgi:hypothetical protein